MKSCGGTDVSGRLEGSTLSLMFKLLLEVCDAMIPEGPCNGVGGVSTFGFVKVEI